MLQKIIKKITVIAGISLIVGAHIAILQPSVVSALSPGTTMAASTCTSKDCEKLYTKYLNPLVKLLGGAVGVVVVLMIVIGGVQYSSAGSDPQQVAEARKKITNAVFALFAYIFLFAFLNWAVPGGII